MKKILTIATLTLGVSAVAVSAFAASNDDMWGGAKSSEPVSLEVMAKEKGITKDELIVQLEKEAKLTESTEPTSSIESSEPVNLEEMAKEKGITLDELIAQLEKEGTLTKAAELTEASNK
ncbi:hypothetical protein ABE042_22610 [Viridibacillus arvi]|uniref:hypothetical protein n=1 Tax=Viridibacillus arvi TaxID=263475 RepID=UPI003D2D61D8